MFSKVIKDISKKSRNTIFTESKKQRQTTPGGGLGMGILVYRGSSVGYRGRGILRYGSVWGGVSIMKFPSDYAVQSR